MNYRADIDGLRAVAVVPVILFHADFAAFSGGFVGVDVFFVISGYLITSVIYQELLENRFSIITFYERRARRILPALCFVSFLCLPVAWLIMLPDEFHSFSKSLIAVNLFSSNILFFKETGYFDQATELKPLLHTWSLAVEEQFYIIFPILLLVLMKIAKQLIWPALICLTVLSLALSEYLVTRSPSANFYLLPTRAWELGIGAMVAVLVIGATQSRTSHNPLGTEQNRFVANSASLIGLGLIISSIVMFDESTPFPSLWALLPTIGTALIIYFGRQDTLVTQLLSMKVLVAIGLVSYSAYLWHQPIFAFARLYSPHEVTAIQYGVLSVVSLCLAYFSWRMIEAPFRNKAKFSRKRIFVLSLAASIALLSAGLSGVWTNGFPNRLEAHTLALLEKPDDPWSDCALQPEGSFDPAKVCGASETSAALILWGDSHGHELVNNLHQGLENYAVPLIELTAQGCTPLIGYEWHNKPLRCVTKLTAMQKLIQDRQNPGDIILIHGRWSNLLNPVQFDNEEGGREPERVTPLVLVGADNLVPGSDEWIEQMSLRFSQTIQPFIDSGQRIVLVYAIPEVGWNVPRLLARQQLFGAEQSVDVSTSHEVFKKRSAPGYKLLDSIGEHPNILRVYPEEVFCDVDIKGRCAATSNSKLLYFDDDHVSQLGSKRVTDLILQKLTQAGWIEQQN